MRTKILAKWLWFGLIVASLCLMTCQQPQAFFQKEIDQVGDRFLSLFEDQNRNLIVGSHDFWNSYLTKYNRNGGKIWSKQYTGSGSLQETMLASDGNYVMIGYFPNFLAKVAPDGNLIWNKTFSASTAFSTVRFYHLAEANDGGFLITGFINPYAASGERAFLLKTDAAGNLSWWHWYEFSDPAYQTTSRGRSVTPTQDGNFVVTGEIFHSTYGAELLLFKVNSAGQPVSVAITYGNTNNSNHTGEYGTSIKEVGSEFIVSGSTGSFSVKDDILLVKTDINLGHIWSKKIGGQESEFENSLALTDDGGFIIQGNTTSYSTGGDQDIFLLKTNSSGDTEWFRVYGGIGDEQSAHHHGVLAPTQTYDGGFALIGVTNSFGALNDRGYLVRTRDDGNAPCHQVTPIPASTQPSWYTHSLGFQHNPVAHTVSDGSSTVVDVQPQETFLCRQSECVNPPPGLTAWYPTVFQASALDVAGGNDAPAGISNITLTNGVVGLAIPVDGTSYKYEAPDNNAIDFGTGDFSVDFWFNANTTQATGRRTILDKRVPSPNLQGYAVYIEDGKIGLQMADGVPTTNCSTSPESWTDFYRTPILQMAHGTL
ncbi:MAG: hypothetical protein AAFO03_06680 [Bacteroidota bacterium]